MISLIGGIFLHFSKRFFYLSIFVMVISFFIQEPTSAHRGGRDELGGHYRSSDCTYFLHDPSSLAKTAKDIDELLSLIKEHNSNLKCSSMLTVNKIELEGYTFSSNGSTTSTKTVEESGELQIGKKYNAILEKCTDGDTATFSINGKSYKTRFLYIDTPESTNQIEPFGKEASAFTCDFLQNGQITLETDGRNLYDKYDRLLAWVWVGDQLHQQEITKAGLVEDFYDYGKYKYEDQIIAAMKVAKDQKVGIYAPIKIEESKKSIESSEEREEVPTVDPIPSLKKENEDSKNENDDMKKDNEVTKKVELVQKSDSIFTNLLFGLIILVVLFIFYNGIKSLLK
jgi:micrococcal nuclease